MSRESLDHVIGGALFDFAGFLTTRAERMVCSSADDAAPMAEAVREFMTLRGVDIECEFMIYLWPSRLVDGKCRPFTTEEEIEPDH